MFAVLNTFRLVPQVRVSLAALYYKNVCNRIGVLDFLERRSGTPYPFEGNDAKG